MESINEAWAEAEAALPDGWHIADLSFLLPHQEERVGWVAEATRVVNGRWSGESQYGHGSTPYVALRDLAAVLHETFG